MNSSLKNVEGGEDFSLIVLVWIPSSIPTLKGLRLASWKGFEAQHGTAR